MPDEKRKTSGHWQDRARAALAYCRNRLGPIGGEASVLRPSAPDCDDPADGRLAPGDQITQHGGRGDRRVESRICASPRAIAPERLAGHLDTASERSRTVQGTTRAA